LPQPLQNLHIALPGITTLQKTHSGNLQNWDWSTVVSAEKATKPPLQWMRRHVAPYLKLLNVKYWHDGKPCEKTPRTPCTMCKSAVYFWDGAQALLAVRQRAWFVKPCPVVEVTLRSRKESQCYHKSPMFPKQCLHYGVRTWVLRSGFLCPPISGFRFGNLRGPMGPYGPVPTNFRVTIWDPTGPYGTLWSCAHRVQGYAHCVKWLQQMLAKREPACTPNSNVICNKFGNICLQSFVASILLQPFVCTHLLLTFICKHFGFASIIVQPYVCNHIVASTLLQA
jgi:hypothetical protein